MCIYRPQVQHCNLLSNLPRQQTSHMYPCVNADCAHLFKYLPGLYSQLSDVDKRHTFNPPPPKKDNTIACPDQRQNPFMSTSNTQISLNADNFVLFRVSDAACDIKTMF